MELTKNGDETRQTTKLTQDCPEQFSVHCIECFCEFHEASIKVSVLLPGFYLELTNHKDHVRGAPVLSETWLRFWQDGLSNQSKDPWQKIPSQDLSGSREERDGPVVPASSLVSLSLVDHDDVRIFPLLRNGLGEWSCVGDAEGGRRHTSDSHPEGHQVPKPYYSLASCAAFFSLWCSV